MIIELKSYQKELKEINEELQTLPTGYLIKRGAFYVHYINEKEIGITRNDALIRLLCRKRYLTARQEQLNHNISIISRCISKFDDATPEKIINSFPASYQEVPRSYFFRQPTEGWAAGPYEKNPYRPEDLIYFSNNGTPVRSKSEMLIANHLESYDIPYRFEVAITLGHQTKYPDFTIKKPSNGKLILWEHFGALGQPNYVQKMNEKMGLYIKHGYIPSETFICTFEADIRSIRRLPNLIETIIL